MSETSTASDLYAFSQGRHNSGPDQCYWCGSSCERTVPHGDPPRDIGALRTFAKRPGNQYMCVGCQLWRRPSLTAFSLSGSFRDRQTPRKLSWLITDKSAVTFDAIIDGPRLYERLLKPPSPFCLIIRDGEGVDGLLQKALVNHGKILNDTELQFTINNIRFVYSVYELEEGLRNGENGRLPGVRELIRIFGPHKLPEDPKTKSGGTPKGTSVSAGVKRMITSG